MSAQTAPMKSNLKRLMFLALGLLIVAAAANATTILQVARGQRSLKGIIYGLAEGNKEGMSGWTMPPNAGAEDAKVKVEIFAAAGNPCHVDSVLKGQALGKVDPARIRVEFVSSFDAKNASRASEVKLGCDQGIAINGQTKFTVPGVDEKGKKKDRTIYFTGDGKWATSDLHLVLDRELKKAYKKGLHLDAAAFETRINNTVLTLKEALKLQLELEGKEEKG